MSAELPYKSFIYAPEWGKSMNAQSNGEKKKPKIGIAISLYNKFDELAILIDIIRKNWQEDYVISVCSNFPGAKSFLEKLDIDSYVIGDDINFNPKMEKPRSKVNLTSRIFDCVRKSCGGANKLDCDYVMHLHTDAWPLKEEAVQKLARELQEKKKVLAVRGMGYTRYRQDAPLGHVDDMFFMYDADYFRKIDFFNVNPLAMIPGRLSIHGILSTLFLGKLQLDKIYFYDNLTNLKDWDGSVHNIEFRGVIPSAIDAERGFLHVHKGGLPDPFCENIQAMYLHEHGITKGEHVKAFLEKFYVADKKKLFTEIHAAESKINRRLQWNGFLNPRWSRFGRDCSRKLRYLGYPLRKKMRYWKLAMIRNTWEGTMKKWFGVEITPDFNLWPESIESFYTRMLQEEDYPLEMRWYEKKRDKVTTDKPIYKGYKVYW